jgi:hypothetical protein
MRTAAIEFGCVIERFVRRAWTDDASRGRFREVVGHELVQDWWVLSQHLGSVELLHKNSFTVDIR